MERLNLLEEHVHRLLDDLETVRSDNRRILQDSNDQVAELQEQLQAVKEENHSLKDLLAKERQVKDDVLQRIDVLLERMKSIE